MPEFTVHRPRGLLPKLVVGQRTVTVVDYQPSWLLLIIPAAAVLMAKRKSTRAPEGDAVQTGPVVAPPAAAPDGDRFG